MPTTESLIECEGFTIRLKFQTNRGATVTIFKIKDSKWFNLRAERWNFCDPIRLTKRATDYIYNSRPKLDDKYLKLLAEYEKRKAVPAVNPVF